MKDLFSPREQEVLRILGRRKMKIAEITDKMFSSKNREGANNGVAQAVRLINAKCEYHKLPWFLNGAGIGRGGKTIWRDKNLSSGKSAND